jgi:hypothetical protein
MSLSNNWEFRFLLHNLELKDAFNSKFMAIVPNNYPRIRKIIADVPAVASLIQNFTDQHGKIYKVALSCHFGQLQNKKQMLDEEPNYRELFDRRALENALIATLEDRKQ